jgi:hypothetical protein
VSERAARAGADLTKSFIELVRNLGWPIDGRRHPDQNGTARDEVYTYPLDISCVRVERPKPGNSPPGCHLKPGSMRGEFW